MRSAVLSGIFDRNGDFTGLQQACFTLSGCVGVVCAAGKDASEVDNDFFLIALPILDHQGPLMTSFPVENRLLPQVNTVGQHAVCLMSLQSLPLHYCF